MANPLETTFLTHLRAIPNYKNKTYLIAYSAGADSTAVLHIANLFFKKFKLNFDTVFFSHTNCKLNEGEADNLALAQKTCDSLGIKIHHEVLDMSNKGSYSLEQYGRILRHQFYKDRGYDIVLMGHHKDDQNETTMTQLFRGAGVGTQAMKVLDNHFFRPFLDFRKKDLLDYLRERNFEWLDDPTNSNNDMTRNFWRNDGLPTIEKHYPHYTACLDVVRTKFSEQEEMAQDLAIIDGLDEFIQSGKMRCPPSILRTSNLITSYLKANNISHEPNKVKQVISDHFHLKKFSLTFSQVKINIQNDEITSDLTTNMTVKVIKKM